MFTPFLFNGANLTYLVTEVVSMIEQRVGIFEQSLILREIRSFLF